MQPGHHHGALRRVRANPLARERVLRLDIAQSIHIFALQKSMRRHGADERDDQKQNRRPLRESQARRLRRQDQNDQNCWQQKSRRFPVVEDEIKQIRQSGRSRDRGQLPCPFPLA